MCKNCGAEKIFNTHNGRGPFCAECWELCDEEDRRRNEEKKTIVIEPSDAVCKILATVKIPGKAETKGFDSYEEAADWALNYNCRMPTCEEVTGNGRWGCD